MQVVIEPDGTTRMIHADAVDLACLGAQSIARASHVEPNEDCTWSADLSPVGGPVLGPFKTRGEALAAELGCEDEFSGLWTVNAVDLSIEYLRELFDHRLRYVAASHSRFNVLLIEELEALPSVQVQRAMKTYLELRLREMRCIVVATSNGAAGLSKPLLQRFRVLCFPGGPGLRRAGQERLAEIWRSEAGERPMPAGWLEWGCDEDGDFSMRVAIDELEAALFVAQCVGVGA